MAVRHLSSHLLQGRLGHTPGSSHHPWKFGIREQYYLLISKWLGRIDKSTEDTSYRLKPWPARILQPSDARINQVLEHDSLGSTRCRNRSTPCGAISSLSAAPDCGSLSGTPISGVDRQMHYMSNSSRGALFMLSHRIWGKGSRGFSLSGVNSTHTCPLGMGRASAARGHHLLSIMWYFYGY
jgi:hypothetical protein